MQQSKKLKEKVGRSSLRQGYGKRCIFFEKENLFTLNLLSDRTSLQGQNIYLFFIICCFFKNPVFLNVVEAGFSMLRTASNIRIIKLLFYLY